MGTRGPLQINKTDSMRPPLMAGALMNEFNAVALSHRLARYACESGDQSERHGPLVLGRRPRQWVHLADHIFRP